MISPPGMWWGSAGSPVMPEYGNEITDGLARSGSALRFLDRSPPWESLEAIYGKGSVDGLLANTGPFGAILVTL